MAGFDRWSEREMDGLERAIGTGDPQVVIAYLNSIGKTFPPFDEDSKYYYENTLFEVLVRTSSAEEYRELRKIGLPGLEKAGTEILFRTWDNQYFSHNWTDPRLPLPEQEEAIARFIQALLDDGFKLHPGVSEALASSRAVISRSDPSKLVTFFARKMHDNVDLLDGLRAAGYIVVAQSAWQWCEIIDNNNINYAQYCFDNGAALPTKVPLVIGGGVKIEMLNWLFDHGARFAAVFPSACREVLERCLELGIPLAKQVSHAPNPYLTHMATDNTTLASSISGTHQDQSVLRALIDDDSHDFSFRVFDGKLVEYRGTGEEVLIPSGVKTIGKSAFCGNEHVKRVVIPDGVEKLEEYSFIGCPNLEEVFVSSSVNEISSWQEFVDCPRLSRIDVDPNSETFISIGGVLCTKQHSFTAFGKKHVVPEGIVRKYPAAQLQNEVVIVPEGIVRWDNEYVTSNATRLVLPSTMEELGSLITPDGWKQLEAIEVAEGNKHLKVEDGALLCKESKTTWAVVAYPPHAPWNSYVTSDGCTSIRSNVFYGLSSFKAIVGPSVSSVGRRAFRGCGEVEVAGEFLPFDESVFAEELGTALMLPNISIEAVPPKLKGFAATGYMHLVCDGRPLSQQINEGYTKYVRGQKKRLIPLMATDSKVAEYILNEGLIPKKEVPALEELAEKSGNEELKELVRRYASNPKPLAGWREERLGSYGFEVQEEAPAPKVEPLVADLLTRHDISSKIKAQIRKGVQLADGSGVSSPEALQLLVELTSYPRKKARTVRYSSTDYEYLYALDWKTINKLAELLDKKSLSDSLEQLFYGQKVQEALVAVCAFGDDEAVERLVESMKSWDHWDGNGNSRRDLAIARGALLYNDSIEAMRHFESRKMLDVYARERGMSADELRDRTLSDFGFSKEGRRVFDLGTKTVTATIGDDLKIVLFDDGAGKEVKSIPKHGTDPEKAEAAAAELAEMRKQIRTIVKQRKDLLFEDFLSGRERRIGAWKDAYLGNPVLRSVARLIVWQKGDVTFTVSDGKLVDATGAPVKLPAGDVKVAHPIEMTKADVDAWRAYFATRGLKQPFAQVWEKAVPKSSIKKDRYAGYPIPVYRFKGQEKHGIHLDLGEYNDTAVQISFDYDTAECEIKQLEFEWHSLKNRVEIVSFTPRRRSSPRKLNHLVAYLDRVCFYPRLASNDLTVMDDLNDPTLEQLIDYMRIASENGATELAALLLEYREEHFPEYGSVESLLLD